MKHPSSAVNKTKTTFENYVHNQFENEVDSDELIIDGLLEDSHHKQHNQKKKKKKIQPLKEHPDFEKQMFIKFYSGGPQNKEVKIKHRNKRFRVHMV